MLAEMFVLKLEALLRAATLAPRPVPANEPELIALVDGLRDDQRRLSPHRPGHGLAHGSVPAAPRSPRR
ncbi:hypothetical protein X566_05845 [Afipia sp. P52-10]|jgi:hypothetical protein|nr:hypothetical protein X566_05845 [Afipia sp. P52-10]